MKLSEVIDVLGKAKQIIGDAAEDAEVVLKNVEDSTGSVIQRIEVAFVAGAEAVTSQLTLVHGPAPVNLDPPAAVDPTPSSSGSASATPTAS